MKVSEAMRFGHFGNWRVEGDVSHSKARKARQRWLVRWRAVHHSAGWSLWYFATPAEAWAAVGRLMGVESEGE